MSEEKPSGTSSSPLRLNRNMWIVAAAIAVAAILVFVLLSPSLSPLASVHDEDGDGHPDSEDAFPDDPLEWSDTDDDGWGDNADDFPTDPDEHLDTDGDGVGDNADEFPEDPLEWSDTDDDGWGDNADDFPTDPDEHLDTDGDGVGDNADAFPNDPDLDSPEINMVSTSYLCVFWIQILSVTPSFEWDDLSVVMNDPENEVSWEPMAEYQNTDDPHNYDTKTLGDILVYLRVIDSYGDGLVSAGDVLEIHVDGSVFNFWTLYWINVSYEPTGESYIVGAFMYETFTPYTGLDLENITGGHRFVIGPVETWLHWDVLTFVLTDGVHAVIWSNVTAQDLDDGAGDIQNYGPADLGGLEVTMMIEDGAGNGIVDENDSVILLAEAFDPDTVYMLTIDFEPTHEAFATEVFGEEPETPITTLTRSPVTDGVRFTFAPVSSLTPWGYVVILLYDESEVVAWLNISTEDLIDGVAATHNYGVQTLGDLNVTLTIVDIAGNGYVNQGDYFTLTAISFEASVDYVVAVVYEPTGVEMTHTSFTG